MSLPSGSSLMPGELEKINAALAEATKDVHAPRELSVKVRLYVHREYPKHLYKGTGTANIRVVNNNDEEAAAIESGFGAFQPEPSE